MSAEELLKDNKDPVRKQKITEAVKFTNAIRARFGGLIKGSLIFGSIIKNKPIKKTSDTDILVLVDDTAEKVSKADIEADIQLVAKQIGDLHIQVHYITQFWEWLRHGDPILFNFLRFGFPLYDSGFIKPTQRLLKMGAISPSREAILLYSTAAARHIEKAESYKKAAAIKLYEAMTSITQAVMMLHYSHQAEPKEIPSLLAKMAKKGIIRQEMVREYEGIYKLWKDIDHNKLKKVHGKILDEKAAVAESYIKDMAKLMKAKKVEK